MCGIAGVFGRSTLEDPAKLAHDLSRCVEHRGPDGEGFLALHASGDHAAERLDPRSNMRACHGVFVHRRLAILDLEGGAQPMESADAPAWIIFNGEIYNYRELRAELATTGSRFHTESDTEVILAAYLTWGIPGFARLNGMFAFALFDGRTREVILVRDPIGVKPLYWGKSGNTVWFGSEIRVGHTAGLVRSEIDPDALLLYMYYRFVPAPRTLSAGVNKVMPGHALRFRLTGEVVSECDFVPLPRRDGRQQELPDEFVAAVRRQMVSDVPIGAFLSGGLDSSLVVNAMRGVSAPTTFAIGFSGDADGGELAIAKRAAQVLGTDHHEIAHDRDDYCSRLPTVLTAVEEPLAHPGMLLQWDLAAEARRRVKVVLTGQGADEPMGGYPRHQIARLLSAFGSARGTLSYAFPRGARGTEAMRRLVNAVRARSQHELSSRIFSPLSPLDAASFLRRKPTNADALVEGAITPWWNRSANLDPMSRLLYVDTRTSLPDDLLLVSDKTAMAHSLEARVPFLDLDYLRRVESISGRVRVPLFGPRKPLQLALAKATLPSPLEARLRHSTSPFRRKHGFDVPIAQWMRSRRVGALEEFVAGREACLPQYMEPEKLVWSMTSFVAGRDSGYRFTLSLIVLEMWLRTTFAGATAQEVSASLPLRT